MLCHFSPSIFVYAQLTPSYISCVSSRNSELPTNFSAAPSSKAAQVIPLCLMLTWRRVRPAIQLCQSITHQHAKPIVNPLQVMAVLPKRVASLRTRSRVLFRVQGWIVPKKVLNPFLGICALICCSALLDGATMLSRLACRLQHGSGRPTRIN